MTAFAARYPERLGGAVHLDAAFDYAAADAVVLRRPFQRNQCGRFARTAPQATVVAIDGHHFIFIAREADVLRAVRTFLLALP